MVTISPYTGRPIAGKSEAAKDFYEREGYTGVDSRGYKSSSKKSSSKKSDVQPVKRKGQDPYKSSSEPSQNVYVVPGTYNVLDGKLSYGSSLGVSIIKERVAKTEKSRVQQLQAFGTTTEIIDPITKTSRSGSITGYIPGIDKKTNNIIVSSTEYSEGRRQVNIKRGGSFVPRVKKGELQGGERKYYYDTAKQDVFRNGSMNLETAGKKIEAGRQFSYDFLMQVPQINPKEYGSSPTPSSEVMRLGVEFGSGMVDFANIPKKATQFKSSGVKGKSQIAAEYATVYMGSEALKVAPGFQRTSYKSYKPEVSVSRTASKKASYSEPGGNLYEFEKGSLLGQVDGKKVSGVYSQKIVGFQKKGKTAFTVDSTSKILEGDIMAQSFFKGKGVSKNGRVLTGGERIIKIGKDMIKSEKVGYYGRSEPLVFEGGEAVRISQAGGEFILAGKGLKLEKVGVGVTKRTTSINVGGKRLSTYESLGEASLPKRKGLGKKGELRPPKQKFNNEFGGVERYSNEIGFLRLLEEKYTRVVPKTSYIRGFGVSAASKADSKILGGFKILSMSAGRYKSRSKSDMNSMLGIGSLVTPKSDSMLRQSLRTSQKSKSDSRGGGGGMNIPFINLPKTPRIPGGMSMPNMDFGDERGKRAKSYNDLARGFGYTTSFGLGARKGFFGIKIPKTPKTRSRKKFTGMELRGL